MIGLLQRVTHASVAVDHAEVGAIGPGLLVLVGVIPADTPASAEQLLDRLLKYRIFADDAGKMNRSLLDIAGGLLLVPQFTLAAETAKGLRPSFSGGAPPTQARELFEGLVALARRQHFNVAAGIFGANMQVSLTNDGPVTFWLET